MDKEWVFLDRFSDEYLVGLRAFIIGALQFSPFANKIKCPCRECKNRWDLTTSEVEQHLLCVGMWNSYVNMPWLSHGEQLPNYANPAMADPLQREENMPDRELHNMLQDAFGCPDDNNMPQSPVEEHPIGNPPDDGPTPDAQKFYELLNDADTDLFPGARMKKLEFLVRLYQIKCLHRASNIHFSKTLELLKAAFPMGETLPKSFYKTKKLIKDFGLSYQKIHACPNDCMLYWKEHVDDNDCHICGISRWKENNSEEASGVKRKAAKILRYFPLGPRLQRLYMSRHTAQSMSWHFTDRTKDGVLRHPADSPAWAKLDADFPEFGNEGRNVRLGLASDGFNPFGNMRSTYSVWPIIISVYNLPPWLCMKQPYLIMSLLIPGPESPCQNIDVYLQPLVEELKLLWSEGLQTYDAFKKETFTMRAAVMWTINDFPAYAMLSGYSTSGAKACPVCGEGTDSIWLPKWGKESFGGTRRWLPLNHRLRGWKDSFNGKTERRTRPKPMTGADCLRALCGLKFQFGKGRSTPWKSKRKRPMYGPHEPEYRNWRKKSVFFELAYWEHLMMRHNLDAMHIEKNVTESLLNTLLGIQWKNKDNKKSRDDIVALKIKHALHPRVVDGIMRYPPGSFSLTAAEKTMICKVFHSAHPPDGFSSNISRCVRVDKRKLVGLKSHDCHIIMQYLLPVTIRHAIMCKKLTKVLLELSAFFRQLCTKVGTADFFVRLSAKIAITLSELESIMPPSFFDIMVHLPIHLADEERLGGPVYYRWMFPIERYLYTLQQYVRNKRHPEGCIAEGYIIDECLSFCSMYLHGAESKRTTIGRNADDPNNKTRPGGMPIFNKMGRSLERGKQFTLIAEDWERAHTYVLINCPEIRHHLNDHVEIEKSKRGRRSVRESERLANLSFWIYFKNLMEEKLRLGATDIEPDILALSSGPDIYARRYKKYVMNGYRFHTKILDTGSNAQNSGIFVSASTNCYSSAHDRQPRDGMLDYYGVLTDIIELDYSDGRKVLLFEADWAESNRGVKKDEWGFTLVNFNHLLPPPDTYVFATQALQVFYIKCLKEPDWGVVVKTKPRDYFDMGRNNDVESYEPQTVGHGLNEEVDGTTARTDVQDVELD